MQWLFGTHSTYDSIASSVPSVLHVCLARQFAHYPKPLYYLHPVQWSIGEQSLIQSYHWSNTTMLDGLDAHSLDQQMRLLRQVPLWAHSSIWHEQGLYAVVRLPTDKYH